MKNNILRALAAIFLTGLLALSVMASAADAMRYGGLLLVTPLKSGSPGISVQKLRQLWEDEFLLTYETRQPKSVEALNSRHLVSAIGTNSCYSGVLGYLMIDGGFFTHAAWSANERHVVLGETAAWSLFGSVNISGKTILIDCEVYIITGVIADGDDENLNIYLPSGHIESSPQSLMVLLGGGVNEAYAVNALKGAGVQSGSYEFQNLSMHSALFGQRFEFAWQAGVCVFAVLLSVCSAVHFVKLLRGLRAELGHFYLWELIREKRGAAIVCICSAVSCLVGIVASALLSLRLLNICLSWRDMPPLSVGAQIFEQRLRWLLWYQWADITLFIFCLCAGAAVFILIGAGLMARGGARSNALLKRGETSNGQTKLARGLQDI